MMRYDYSFAGLNLSVEMPEEVGFREDDQLSVFRSSQTENSHRFCFSLADALDAPLGELCYRDGTLLAYGSDARGSRYLGSVGDDWKTAHSRVAWDGDIRHVQLRADLYAGQVGSKAVLNCLMTEHLIARSGGFIFHCSYIAYQGKAILFTAPSQTGKSTQADLWHDLRGAEIINGDRAAVRLSDGRLMACGIPFAGSSQYCENRTLPIGAIVYLGQAPQTTIRRMRGYEAFSKIWEGVSVNTWDKTDMELVSAAVEAVAAKVPVFHLPCTPDESAVIALEEALRKLELV